MIGHRWSFVGKTLDSDDCLLCVGSPRSGPRWLAIAMDADESLALKREAVYFSINREKGCYDASGDGNYPKDCLGVPMIV
jgi:hypothetical protein